MLAELSVKKVQCYAIIGDNSGPPETADEVRGVYKTISSEYPGAPVISKGGCDGLFEAVISSKSAMESLSISTRRLETRGFMVSSDPLRSACVSRFVQGD
jgi:hypothetical protein